LNAKVLIFVKGPPSIDISMTSVHPAGFGAIERERIATFFPCIMLSPEQTQSFPSSRQSIVTIPGVMLSAQAER
jgi:hypothetical protein